eukprot:TRINITY_DN0_c45_g1_i7.p1 TRINITY_DN0_c45_g1~~TRINITY_DN0_c45_g1_i7.p1  ORF type:complete len:372 (+),score=132.84 TRINITY_DN0_c45_g1_i7:43-1158(+)
MKVLLCLALCGVLAFAGSIRRAEFDAHTVLSEIDQHPFGNALVSLIAVHLSTNGPLEEIVVLLNQLRAGLTKSQEEDDENNRTNQASCEENIRNFQNQISTLTAQRNENIKLRDITQASLNVAEKDLRETINALNLNQQRLTQGQAQRDQEHNEYTNALAEHQQGIKALDGAIQLLNHLQSGTSFVQLKKRFERVTAELLETQKASRNGHLYSPLIQALADLASKATPEMIAKILKLFNELRTAFARDSQVATQIENKQQESWTSLKVDLETERDALQEKRTNLERQIEGYRAIIEDCNRNIEYLTKQLELATENLNATVEHCEKLSATYVSRNEERVRELEIIGRVLEFFEKRAKGFSDSVKQRVEGASL